MLFYLFYFSPNFVLSYFLLCLFFLILLYLLSAPLFSHFISRLFYFHLYSNLFYVGLSLHFHSFLYTCLPLSKRGHIQGHRCSFISHRSRKLPLNFLLFKSFLFFEGQMMVYVLFVSCWFTLSPSTWYITDEILQYGLTATQILDCIFCIYIYRRIFHV